MVILYNDVSDCIFAEKGWVHPRNSEEEVSYEKGCYPRARCRIQDGWCNAEADAEECPWRAKALKG